jgi:hypothetical protein
LWPRALFRTEATKLLNRRSLRDWNERCEALLDDAFVHGYQGGPRSEFCELPDGYPDGLRRLPTDTTTLTTKQRFLRHLVENAEFLSEEVIHRPYWRERTSGKSTSTVLDSRSVVREFVALVDDLDEYGYFEKRFGKECVDDYRGSGPSNLIEKQLHAPDLWPLDESRLADEMDLFFDIVEYLHDLAARPHARRMHSYCGCGWHHEEFEIESGRIVYRWRVNKILQRSNLGLRLADEGPDIGRLVAVTDDARHELVTKLTAREDGPASDQVRHAIELFRARGADRNQKRSAIVELALILEERRNGVLTDALAKSDRGALFEIANNFHLRHQNASQKREYDDFYLDWIFWLYLSTTELTNRIIDEQNQ